MFKMIPQKKHDVLKLILRPKKQKFTPELKKGIAIALCLHLAFLIFFKAIIHENLDERFPLLSPTQIEIDLGLPLNTSSSSIVLAPHIPERSPPIPPLPEIETLSFYPELILQEPDFSELESLAYQPLLLEELIPNIANNMHLEDSKNSRS